MRITKHDKSNLSRFGCSFLSKENLICIRWQEDRKDQALSANIAVRVMHIRCPSGPVLSLEFEISPTKALAHYCYFPFDLTNNIDRKYLSSIFKRGKIQLCFLTDSRQIARTYALLPQGCEGMAGIYEAVIGDLENFPTAKYDFDRIVAEFEQNIRIVDHFECAVSKAELQHLIALSKAQAESTSAEDRAEGARLAGEVLKVFGSRYDAYLGTQLKQIDFYRHVLLLMSDFHSAFAGDYAGFAQFLADTLAAHTPKKHNQQLESWTLLFELIFTLIDHMTETSPESDEASTAKIQADLREIMNRAKGGKGISKDSAMHLISLFGFHVGGLPGRTAKDYSAEYRLRAAGKKWREVAEHNFENDPESRQDFGGRTFAELSGAERSILIHRIKEALRGFAERTKQPFPPGEQA